jgi:hypothetical protein
MWSPRGSSIGYEPRLIEAEVTNSNLPPPIIAWTCQKKKKKEGMWTLPYLLIKKVI